MSNFKLPVIDEHILLALDISLQNVIPWQYFNSRQGYCSACGYEKDLIEDGTIKHDPYCSINNYLEIAKIWVEEQKKLYNENLFK